ncbi:DMT family transporter [Clostridium ganghwense]|uniref:DMT family transporter n=1 Tax=Clostridium ganghwense TaxID=312089 RepID=A0ABT4CJQ4_9CLOT|nr:DMT family transporter [Clostridium ganghwense]MCY6369279.1 DMT family transporter [Clostridium ganghwense]
MNKFYSIILALCIGICLAVQAPINANLGKVINAKNAALNSVLVSSITIFIIILLTGNIKEYSNITKVPPYYWIGGLLGIIVVFGTILIIPALGTLTTFSIIVTVQLVIGALINHFGWFGIAPMPITITKISGIILLICGLRLIMK